MISPVQTSAIVQRKAPPNDKRIRILILTGNEFKKTEYNQVLGETYGANLTYQNPPAKVTNEIAKSLLSTIDPSPHFILREESSLENALTKEVLDGSAIVNNPDKAPNLITNKAKLTVWIPTWENGALKEIIPVDYAHEVQGYIDTSRKELRNDKVFGWDHLFVNARTGKTNQETLHSRWGKTAARQLVLADFVTRYLFYANPKTLNYHDELKPKHAIEFTKEMSVSNFMKKNEYLSNPNLSFWGLDKIRGRILNQGTFYCSGFSRPVNNCFSPPFTGIPITPKSTKVEETIFMMHDLNHHNIPDLIFDGDDSPEMCHVYAGWRMMSEAFTLVIADMLYANTLEKTDPKNAEGADKRIYPLFQALDLPDGNRDETMRRLLWANTQYAVLGDDSEWRKLLKPGQEEKLAAYKNHFEKFFVGDHVWTNANFQNMSSMKEHYQEWISTAGQEQFERAGVTLLSDMAALLKSRGANLSSLVDVVKHAFDVIMETSIFPKQRDPEVVDEETRLSRGFHRYMLGQLNFYIRYQSLPGLMEKGKKMAESLKSLHIDEAMRKEIYAQYKNDVRHVWGYGVITTASADNYMQKHPIFPPVYINYSRQECKTVKEVLSKLYEI